MKYLSLIILVVFGIAFIPNIMLSYSGGVGSSTDPYQIATTADLIQLSKTSGDWGSEKNFIQTADISFNSNNQLVDWDGDGSATWDAGDQLGFSPIGTNSIYFSGNYNGQNHTISNLFINRYVYCIGLFGRTNYTTIRNVGLINVNITGQASVGGLMGTNVNSATISNCFVTGAVTADGNVGGLVGSIYSATISNCYFSGTVTGGGNGCIGGLAGITSSSSAINKCYSTGSVTGTGNYIGGLVGQTNTTPINNSYSTGSVTGAGTVGGLVGNTFNSSPVSNCYATGTVTGSSEQVGGLIGNNASTVTNCFATGSASGTYYIGGLIGYNSSAIVSNCYALGTVTSSSSNAGGFVGVNMSSSAIISNCYSMGNVISSSGSTTNYGGFCGSMSNSTIQSCYSTGSFTLDNNKIHGFIGYKNGGTAANNFFDATTSGQTSGTGATAINTTTNMKTQGTFAGWDFTNTWAMSSAITFAGYPTLQWTGAYSVAPASNQIASLMNLVWVAENSTRWATAYTQTANLDAWTTPSWDGKSGWTPIGNGSTQFIGSYNGQNHIISNLFINRPSTDYIALLGYSNTSTIQNIGLINTNITGNSYVGALVGQNNSSASVSNCYSTGSITGNGSNVGGLMGDIYLSTVSNCYTSAYVTRSSGSASSYGAFCGLNDESTIENCYSTGFVNFGSAQGFVGSSISGTNTNNFFDSETSGQTSGTGATAKTKAQMKSQVTFTNWNFTSSTGVWSIKDATYLSYPYLQASTYDTPGVSPIINPIPGLSAVPVPANPTVFTATVNSISQIDLSWTKNSSGNDVLIAYNTTNTFGTPTGAYSTGNTIVGGGTLIYIGNGASYSHTGLTVCTQYYYKIWSKGVSYIYSTGVTDDEGTKCAAPTATAASNVVLTSFTANWNIATGATKYFLDVATDNTFNSFVAGYNNLDLGNVTTYSVSGLTAETAYYYRVRAYYTTGNSDNSNTISATTAKANFQDNSNNNFATWSDAASGAVGGTVTLLADYTSNSDVALSNSLMLDLNGHTFNSSANKTTISGGKILQLTQSTGSGTFNEKISFVDGNAALGILKNGVIGSGFSIASGSTAGTLIIGDGTTSLVYPFNINDTKFKDKIGKVVVSGATNVNLSK